MRLQTNKQSTDKRNIHMNLLDVKDVEDTSVVWMISKQKQCSKEMAG